MDTWHDLERVEKLITTDAPSGSLFGGGRGLFLGSYKFLVTLRDREGSILIEGNSRSGLGSIAVALVFVL